MFDFFLYGAIFIAGVIVGIVAEFIVVIHCIRKVK